jgi:hypothetical protein
MDGQKQRYMPPTLWGHKNENNTVAVLLLQSYLLLNNAQIPLIKTFFGVVKHFIK